MHAAAAGLREPEKQKGFGLASARRRICRSNPERGKRSYPTKKHDIPRRHSVTAGVEKCVALRQERKTAAI
jgi:hypothetical protein